MCKIHFFLKKKMQWNLDETNKQKKTTHQVAMCGGCNQYEPWAAIVVGVLGGFAFTSCHYAMLRFRLDDPLDAVAVHGAGGIVGVLCVPVFGWNEDDQERERSYICKDYSEFLIAIL